MYKEFKNIMYKEQKSENIIIPNRNINNEKNYWLKKGPNMNSKFEK